MTDVGDDQSGAEFLDDDKLPEAYPPDRPLGVEEYGITASEEEFDEPIQERLRREEPDFDELARRRDLAGEDADEEVGTLVSPDGDFGLDVEGDSVASAIGRLSGRNLSVDDIAYGDDTLRDVATERLGDDGVPAEEAAIHLTAPPPMGDGDGYVDPDAELLVDDELLDIEDEVLAEIEAEEDELDDLDEADDLDDLDGSGT